MSNERGRVPQSSTHTNQRAAYGERRHPRHTAPPQAARHHHLPLAVQFGDVPKVQCKHRQLEKPLKEELGEALRLNHALPHRPLHIERERQG
jgi:hypothetical protein